MPVRTALLASVSWALVSGAAQAQDDPRDQLIRDLTARLDAVELQLADLKESAGADTADVRRLVTEAPQVTLSNARLAVATPDGRFRAQLRGVAQYEFAEFHQKAPGGIDNRRSDANNPGDLSAGGNFRRARFGIEGTAFRDWNFSLLYELGGTGVEGAQMSQAYIEYAGWKPFGPDRPLRFRAGAWATPTGLEDATSNAEHVFLEWASTADLARSLAGGDGRTGFGAFVNGANWYGSAVYTGALMSNTGEFDEQRGFLGRAAWLPYSTPDLQIHLGANVATVLEPADTDPSLNVAKTFRLRGRPELRVENSRFVDTGSIASTGASAYGLELGAAWKNLYLTGEAHRFEIDRVGALPDPKFHGWYVQGAWTITGERRRWNAANGGFSGIRPANNFDPSAGHWGAWELAARYSVLDLDYRAGAVGTAPVASAVRGGEQKIWTVGLSWTPNPVIRFMLNVQNVDVDRIDPENSSIVTAVPGFGAPVGQTFQAVTLRSQLSF